MVRAGGAGPVSHSAALCPQDHRCCMPYTPICIAKAVKNAAESEGMRRAHVSRAARAEDGLGGGQKVRSFTY